MSIKSKTKHTLESAGLEQATPSYPAGYTISEPSTGEVSVTFGTLAAHTEGRRQYEEAQRAQRLDAAEKALRAAGYNARRAGLAVRATLTQHNNQA